MEKNKQEILNKITSVVESLFSDLFSVQKDVDTKKKELQETIAKTSIFFASMDDAQKELAQEKIILNRKSNDLEKEMQSFNIEKAKHEKKVLADLELTKQEISKRDVLKKEISELTAQIDSLKTKEEIGKAVLLDIQNKQEEINSLNKEIDSLKKERDDFFTSFVKEKNTSTKELNDIKENISLEKSIVLPKLKEVEEKEALLKEKENSLNTVIDRYQKLYAEKGAGFRI